MPTGTETVLAVLYFCTMRTDQQQLQRCASTTMRTKQDHTLCSCCVQVQLVFSHSIVSKLQLSEWLVKRLVSHQVLCVKSGDVQVPLQQVALGVGRGCLLQPLRQLMQAVIQAQPWSLPPFCSSKVLSQAVCLLIYSCEERRRRRILHASASQQV